MNFPGSFLHEVKAEVGWRALRVGVRGPAFQSALRGLPWVPLGRSRGSAGSVPRTPEWVRLSGGQPFALRSHRAVFTPMKPDRHWQGPQVPAVPTAVSSLKSFKLAASYTRNPPRPHTSAD